MRWMTAALALAIGLTANGLHPSAAQAAVTPLNADAYATRQCEDYDEQNGIHLEAHTGGLHVGFISRGDWLRYDKLDFTSTPAKRMLFRASNAARQGRTGKVEIHLDALTNPTLASMTIPNNGDWMTFITYELAIPATTGVHTVFLLFTSTQDEEFANMDWFTFKH